MKNLIQFFIASILLTGCYGAGIRFWYNDGWMPSPEEQKIIAECEAEIRQEMRKKPEGHVGSQEVQYWLGEFMGRTSRCEDVREIGHAGKLTAEYLIDKNGNYIDTKGRRVKESVKNPYNRGFNKAWFENPSRPVLVELTKK